MIAKKRLIQRDVQNTTISPVETEIRRQITEKGKITFAEFMDLALYHPRHGYYCIPGRKVGPRGDFVTSPETHPVFGALVALQLEQMWRISGSPRRFSIVEMGGGSGALCLSVLRYSRISLPNFYESVEYILSDRRRDVVACPGGDDRASAIGELERYEKVRRVFGSGVEPPMMRVVGCFLSNELVDAFPVHKVAFIGGKLREVFVGLSDEGFVEVIGDPSTPELAAYFEDLGLWLDDGYRTEVNLEAVHWAQGVARSLQKGFVLTVDYGFPAEELYSDQRRSGNLMCYYHHTYGHNPYVRVGRQDMTTHVDFTSLIRAGLACGLKLTGLVSQADFLANVGMEAFVKALGNAGLEPSVFYNNKFAVRRLAEAEGLGKFRVLVQHKGVVEPSLDCFNPCNDRKRALIARGRMPFIPLLSPLEE